MRAIDLYAGIGGWTLGLRLAGIEVVASYERWRPAVDTHNINHGSDIVPTDIRTLSLDELPSDIDLVVGSPPCTEFSYANRGGGGDLPEGFKDLVRFFEIVQHLNPKIWCMENVPRVAALLEKAAESKKHVLYRYRDLFPVVRVVDFSAYGLPQARKRCIAGCLPFEIIESFRSQCARRTLGDVTQALAASAVRDPVWGLELPSEQVTGREVEPHLGPEELRMNREAKTFHPVYNGMSFPDLLDAPSRTVTATCTRVSRESIIIPTSPGGANFRRLSIRERASLQGFPITYQVHGRSFSERAKMVGNAIPPTFTYLVGCAALGRQAEAFERFEAVGASLELPPKLAPPVRPEARARHLSKTRTFRTALPGLRFKSGMRFELANATGETTRWSVRFFFGLSTDIQEVELDGSVLDDIRLAPVARAAFVKLGPRFAEVTRRLQSSDPDKLQSVWNRRAKGLSPHELVDLLAGLADDLTETIQSLGGSASQAVIPDYVLAVASPDAVNGPFAGREKLREHATRVLAGFVVGDWFNTLAWHLADKGTGEPEPDLRRMAAG